MSVQVALGGFRLEEISPGFSSEVLLDSRELTASAASITFSDISQDYDHIRIELRSRSDTAGTALDGKVELNGDSTASNYYRQDNSAFNNSGGHGETNDNKSFATIGTSAPAGTFAHTTISIPEYTQDSSRKIAVCHTWANAGASVGEIGDFERTLAWDGGTSAITSVKVLPVSGNFVSGTIARLIGIKAGQVAQVGGMTKIYDYEVTGTEADITIDNIPQKYDDLYIRLSARSTDTGEAGDLNMQMNGDTTDTNYHMQQNLVENGARAAATESNYSHIGSWYGTGAQTDAFFEHDIRIPRYSDTKVKVAHSSFYGASQTAKLYLHTRTWHYRPNTNAITSLRFWPSLGSFAAGTRIIVYGVGGAASLGTLPTNYIEGLKAVYNTASTVDIETGSCRDDSDTVDITVGSTLTADITAGGANGLDTGSEANSTWYYLWVISKADGTAAALLSTSSSSPTMPSGYLYKRLLGAVRNDGSGDFYPFNMTTKRTTRRFYYEIPIADSRLRVDLGALTTAAGWTDADCSKAIPPIADEGYYGLYYDNGNGGSNSNFQVLPKGFSEAGNGMVFISAGNSQWGNSHLWLPPGTDQVLRCKVDVQDADAAVVDIIGWAFNA